VEFICGGHWVLEPDSPPGGQATAGYSRQLHSTCQISIQCPDYRLIDDVRWRWLNNALRVSSGICASVSTMAGMATLSHDLDSCERRLSPAHYLSHMDIVKIFNGCDVLFIASFMSLFVCMPFFLFPEIIANRTEQLGLWRVSLLLASRLCSLGRHRNYLLSSLRSFYPLTRGLIRLSDHSRAGAVRSGRSGPPQTHSCRTQTRTRTIFLATTSECLFTIQ
jgi:hypothetical protein